MAEESDISSGIFLTWEDLWVNVSLGRKGDKSILQGLTGYARPNELLAVMGPSGSGKSTLLDALAGRLGSNTKQTGNLLINGCEQRLAYGTLAYVMQEEALTATLTVKEALYYSASLQLPNSMTNLEKKQRAETVIKEMGLKQAMNTRVGGWGIRGLSGGQKRRLSICIEILGHPKLLFLDEPTSGLDSAASYYVMSSIARQKMGKTIIATIHQPSAQVFNLFDNVCLLSSGRNVYFGSTQEANEFFASKGFPCPSLQNPSDHFLQTINDDFEEDIEPGLSQRRPTEEVTHLLINGYNLSDQYHSVSSQIADRKKAGAALESQRRAKLWTQCLILTRRSFLNMSRDYGYYWMRLAMQIMIAIGLGSIYFDLGSTYESIQARGSMLMYVATFFTYMSIGGFPSFLEDMKVFQRERLNGHYGPSAFAISHTLSSIPYLLLTSILSGAIAYYLAGLQTSLLHFAYFALVVFVTSMMVESLQMVVASLVPNFLMGLIIVSGIQGIMMLGGGFFRLPTDLPNVFWKYPLYFIAVHKYAYQGLFKNEFMGLFFLDKNLGGGNNHQHKLKGASILKHVWQVDMDYSKWVDLWVLVGMVVVYRLMFVLSMKIHETVKLNWVFSRKKKNFVSANPDGSPLVGINHVQMEH